MEDIETLLAAAASGKRLHTVQRRKCIAYLIETGQAPSQRAMGRLFGVDEKMIRKDKLILARVRKETPLAA